MGGIQLFSTDFPNELLLPAHHHNQIYILKTDWPLPLLPPLPLPPSHSALPYVFYLLNTVYSSIITIRLLTFKRLFFSVAIPLFCCNLPLFDLSFLPFHYPPPYHICFPLSFPFAHCLLISFSTFRSLLIPAITCFCSFIALCLLPNHIFFPFIPLSLVIAVPYPFPPFNPLWPLVTAAPYPFPLSTYQLLFSLPFPFVHCITKLFFPFHSPCCLPSHILFPPNHWPIPCLSFLLTLAILLQNSPLFASLFGNHLLYSWYLLLIERCVLL